MADFGTVFQNEIFNKEYSKNNTFDYFFTKRTTSYTKEIINKDLSREDKKFKCVNNFMVLNLNLDDLKKEDTINMEIWGDKGYFYNGKIFDNSGFFPSLALKLKEDTQLFLKIKITNKNNEDINYINFINIPKKYQIDEDDNESEINV